MSQRIVYVLCEGQTEEEFVKRVLNPYLMQAGGIVAKAVVLCTSRRKDAHGGMISYGQAKKELGLLFRQHRDGEYESFVFTTMFDLYALPADFPGMDRRDGIADQRRAVETLERALAADVAEVRFIPYIQLHEFEALVFCGLEFLKEDYPRCEAAIDGLIEVRAEYGCPELINSTRETSPCHRLIDAIEGEQKYRYNKPKIGAKITAKVGIEQLCAQCPHFGDWIRSLMGNPA